MTDLAQKLVDGLMEEVEAGHLKQPDLRTINYSVTLTNPEEVNVGSEVHKLFDQRLKSYFSGASITSKGYGAGGYNIVVRVDK